MALKGGGEGGTWQWQGNENFILIAAVSAIHCQMPPPGGHFGKNPLFKKKKCLKPRCAFYLPQKANIFSISVVKQQKEYVSVT